MKLPSELGNTPIDFAVLKSMFSDYKSKISELEKFGKLIRRKKGMYVISPNNGGAKEYFSIGIRQNQSLSSAYK